MSVQRCAGCETPGAALCTRCARDLITSTRVATSYGVIATADFDGLVKHLVVALKYRNGRRLARPLAANLARCLDPTTIDVVTWAPTTRRHVRRRGYDQAELLARALARQWRVPCRRLLLRAGRDTQTGHTRTERMHGPTFSARPLRRPTRVLVIDDVVTTGSTLRAARLALLAAGAGSVTLAAVAATAAHPASARADLRETA